MRNATVFILLTLFSISIFGTYPTFCYLQSLARTEIKNRLENAPQRSELTKIYSMSNGCNLVWEEPGKEFHLTGKMYDIVYTSVTDSGTWFYCLDDYQEAKLFSALDKEVQKELSSDHTKKGKTAKHILSRIFLDYLCPESADLGMYKLYEAIFFVALNAVYQSTCQLHPSPPPELA